MKQVANQISVINARWLTPWDCNDKKIDLLKQLNNYIKGLNKNGNKTI